MDNIKDNVACGAQMFAHKCTGQTMMRIVANIRIFVVTVDRPPLDAH